MTESNRNTEEQGVRTEPQSKKNLISLFAVAFVVALIATGVFYGLFVGPAGKPGDGPAGPQMVVATRNLDRGTVLSGEDVKAAPSPGDKPPAGAFGNPNEVVGATVLEPIQANEAILQARVTPRGQGSAEGVIAKGMRALSLHVTDSAGVVSMLRSGQRVDLQMVAGNGPETQLKTILQNVEVLNVPAPENGRPVVNLLLRADEADLVALADSAGRVRLVLRHPKDEAQMQRAALVAASLLRGIAIPRATESVPASQPAVAQKAAPAAASEQVAFVVRAAQVSPAALERLGGRGPAGGPVKIHALPTGGGTDQLLGQLERDRTMVTLSGANATAASQQETVVRSGSVWDTARHKCGVRVSLAAAVGGGGKLRLRLQPEVIAPKGDTVTTRKVDAELAVADGQSVAITGLFDGQDAALLERVYPSAARSGAANDIVLLVTPRVVRSNETAALRGGARN